MTEASCFISNNNISVKKRKKKCFGVIRLPSSVLQDKWSKEEGHEEFCLSLYLR